MITTTNLTIDPELCKRLDAAMFGNAPASQIVVDKWNIYHAELIGKIAELLGRDVAHVFTKKSLYYLCTLIETEQYKQGRKNREELAAGAQSARTQLKAWDWEGLK